MISAALAAGLALTMTVTAFADEPYTAYNYDYWDDAIPSQSAYRVEKTVTGADMGLDRLSDPSDPTQIENYDKRLLDLVSYIGINYGDASITLESLAILANMHSSSLIRLFKEQTGVTPMQFVNRTRLMAAKRMLLYSNKSIKEIALETGFGEQQSFVRSLRQDTGLTPSDFRRVMGCEEPEE